MNALLHWATLPPAERTARCRALAAISRLFLGRDADALIDSLRQAEADPTQLVAAAIALEAVPTVPRRRILCSFAESSLPPAPRVTP